MARRRKRGTCFFVVLIFNVIKKLFILYAFRFDG